MVGKKEEAIAMIDDSKRAWLSTALENEVPIPEPTSENFTYLPARQGES